MADSKPITLAIPKGRISQVLYPLFEKAGIDTSCLTSDDRRLVRETADGKFRFLQVKPDDVPTYVEYGVADLGVSGRDTLMERRYDLYQLVDLGIGQCRMVVAAPQQLSASVKQLVSGADASSAVPRVATKYPRVASEHFAKRGIHPEVIYVAGSVELAPLVGLCDCIVDLVETGTTLRENGLVEVEDICSISSLLVANRSLFKLRHKRLAPVVERFRKATGE